MEYTENKPSVVVDGNPNIDIDESNYNVQCSPANLHQTESSEQTSAILMVGSKVSDIGPGKNTSKEETVNMAEIMEEDVADNSQQIDFIGPVIPGHLIKGTNQNIIETADGEKQNLDSSVGQREIIHASELKDLVQDSYCEQVEPLCKKMRYKGLDNEDIKVACEQVLDDSSFNLPKKDKVTSHEHVTVVTTVSTKTERKLNPVHEPVCVTSATAEFQISTNDNYLRGCKWAPDGTCLLTNSNDNYLRLFDLPTSLYEENINNIPELKPVVKVKESDTIYDYCWYPKMTSQDPETSCFVSTCKDSPVHLWDGFTGQLRCSYRPYNHVDELALTYSLGFSIDGHKLFCGSNKMIRIFDADRPGRNCVEIPTYSKQFGQSGIISCIVPSPQGMGVFAAGSYSRSIALYNENKKNMVCMFEGQQGGVTHLIFSPDGTKLYSGGRKDPEIICWDLRNPGQILFVVLREVETNQRMYFELDKSGRYLMSGNHDGRVSVWDTSGTPVKKFQDSDLVLEPVLTFKAHNDTVNGVSFHPTLPLIATSCGQRHFPELGDSENSDTEEDLKCQEEQIENSVKLWWFS